MAWIGGLIFLSLIAQKAVASPREKEARKFWEMAYQKAAESGDLQAQLKLGDMYLWGIGISPVVNCAFAKKYLESAAIGGLNDARYLMGHYFFKSECPKNPTRALAWYLLAAQNGHSAANAMVGFMYLSGREVPKSVTNARKYFELAFERDKHDHYLTSVGSQDVAAQLGAMKVWGIGGEKQIEEGMKLISQAASQGSHNAQKYLSEIGQEYASIPRVELENIALGTAFGILMMLFVQYLRRRREEENESVICYGEFQGVISHLPNKIQSTLLKALPEEFDKTLVEALPVDLLAMLARGSHEALAPAVFSHIPSDLQARMLASIPEEKFSKILHVIKGDDRAVVNVVRKAARLRQDFRIISH